MQTKKKILDSKKLLLILSSIFLVTGCSTVTSSTTTEQPTNSNSEPTLNPSEDPTYPVTGIDDFDIYLINDLHGATRFIDGNHPQIGLAKMSTIFEDFRNNNTSFLVSSGDMWQETLESNLNYGAYVTEAMNFIEFDAMALGNHEFDWGFDKIIQNSDLAEYPFLAANLIYKDNLTRPEGIDASVLVERDGIKLGIIGTLGESVYDSISYRYVSQFNFDIQHDYIVSEAEKLRQQGADAVVLATHDSYVDDKKEFTQDKKDFINDAKLDAVLSGHSHLFQNDVFTRDDGVNVPIVQAYSRGTAFAKISFEIDRETRELTFIDSSVESFNKYKNAEEDQRIVDLYNERYNIDELKNEEICTLNGSFNKKVEGACLAATATYEAVVNNDKFKQYNVLCGTSNQARKDMNSGPLSYEELFNSYPFDNEIIIFKADANYVKSHIVRGWDIPNNTFDKSQNLSGDYYIASSDYLAFKYASLDDAIYTGLYVRDVIEDYMRQHKTLNAKDYR